MSAGVVVTPLRVEGALLFTPTQHRDDRGLFCEWYRADVLEEAVGHSLALAQANCSVSRRGVLRGIHFAAVPPGQAKYVTCAQGAILDVVVDIRVGSPTFGAWDAVRIDDVDRQGMYLAEGLGHAFLALSDSATVMYLCSTGYAPGREHGVHPMDPAIGIDWPARMDPILSEKDASAPTLAEAADQDLLPDYQECLAWTQRLRGGPSAGDPS